MPNEWFESPLNNNHCIALEIITHWVYYSWCSHWLPKSFLMLSYRNKDILISFKNKSYRRPQFLVTKPFLFCYGIIKYSLLKLIMKLFLKAFWYPIITFCIGLFFKLVSSIMAMILDTFWKVLPANATNLEF